MCMRYVLSRCLCLTLVLYAVGGEGRLLAQSNGTVKGIVKDTTGAVLPGATVSLTNKATQQTTETLTTEAGTYVFPFVTPAEYTLSIDMPGFKRLVRSSLIVTVSETVV